MSQEHSFLGKCRACKKPSQFNAEVAERRKPEHHRVTGKRLSTERRSWRVTTGKHAGLTTRIEAPWNGRWQIGASCPKCEAPMMTFNAVAGTVTEKPCGGRCMGSTGPSCECSCGGKNHGKSHA